MLYFNKTCIKKELKARGISFKDVRKILNGDFDPLPFSEDRFKNKLKEVEEDNDEFNKGKKRQRIFNRDSFYPKYELKDILRDLKYQRLDEPFFYDKIKAPTIPVNTQTSMVMPDKTTALTKNRLLSVVEVLYELIRAS